MKQQLIVQLYLPKGKMKLFLVVLGKNVEKRNNNRVIKVLTLRNLKNDGPINGEGAVLNFFSEPLTQPIFDND